MQHQGDAFYFIANYHSLTSLNDGELLNRYTLDVTLDYLALGMDPQKCTFFAQSDVPQVTELAWILGTLCPVSLMEKGVAYKDKVAQGLPANIDAERFILGAMWSTLRWFDPDGPIGLDEMIRQITEDFCDRENWLFLGRGYHFPIALEGALKLKEISYIHAEGYPAAELKHGPIALVDENTPSVFIMPHGVVYDKVMSNLQEIKARGGPVIAVASEADTEIEKIADAVIRIPAVEEFLQPIVSIIPLQLIAYHIALLRGCDVDKPRNLAKSVTVE
jgi:hypothetical protein